MKVESKACFALIALVWLCATSGCQTQPGTGEPPKYSDLLKAWKPIRVYHAGDGSHIVVVQEVNDEFESGKYIVPMTSSLLPAGLVGLRPEKAGSAEVFTPWSMGGSSLIVLESDHSGLAEVYNYRKSQPDGPANRSQPIRSETNGTSAAAGSGR